MSKRSNGIPKSNVVCDRCGGTGGYDVPAPMALRRRREKTGMSLRALAKQLGYSTPYLSDVERGRRNTTAKILAAYEAL